jgi:hypothetical protein
MALKQLKESIKKKKTNKMLLLANLIAILLSIITSALVLVQYIDIKSKFNNLTE